jgi:hypothetical protein
LREATTTTLPAPMAPTPRARAVANSKPVNGRLLPEPLVAPPPDARWQLAWSSEDPRYGGCGAAPFDPDGPWRLPAQAALVLRAVPRAR